MGILTFVSFCSLVLTSAYSFNIFSLISDNSKVTRTGTGTTRKSLTSRAYHNEQRGLFRFDPEIRKVAQKYIIKKAQLYDGQDTIDASPNTIAFVLMKTVPSVKSEEIRAIVNDIMDDIADKESFDVSLYELSSLILSHINSLAIAENVLKEIMYLDSLSQPDILSETSLEKLKCSLADEFSPVLNLSPFEAQSLWERLWLNRRQLLNVRHSLAEVTLLGT